MTTIFNAITEVAFEIDNAIKTHNLEYSENENSSGEMQLKLDVTSDLIVEKAFALVKTVCCLVSEEKDEKVKLHESGIYTVCYDPLDGSSLVDVNLSVGTIFGIYSSQELKAESLLASAYIVYGPRLELVFAQKNAKPMLYRAELNEFKPIRELVLNEKGKLNSPGGTQKNWLPHHKELVDKLFSNGYRLRYSGGMVPDLHQILLKGGGLFSYPATSDKPQGKLRQLFEVIPFAFIYEQAGGEAIDGSGNRLMELIPEHLHDTSPCFFGSKEEIKLVKEAYAK